MRNITKNILLTGGSGQLGQAIIRSGLFPEILAPTRLELDITSPQSVENFFKNNNIDAVIHCAALARMSECENNPSVAIDTNIAGTANLVKEIINQENIFQKEIRFIHISTDGVYPCTKGNYNEEDKTIPYNKYGWTKLGAECSIKLLKNHCVVRTSFFDPCKIRFDSAATDSFSSKMPINNLARAIAFLLGDNFVGTINVGAPGRSDYDCYHQYKPELKKCARANISQKLSFAIYENATLDIGRWNKIKNRGCLNIIIPVYNEKDNILPVLSALKRDIKSKIRVLLCYDNDDDNTLPIACTFRNESPFEIIFVKNRGVGVHGAVLTGFEEYEGGAVLVYPADDDFNTKIIDKMYEMIEDGYDVVAASRFMKGGSMVGAPPLKGLLVQLSSLVLHYLARVPCCDASNGFRMFSKSVIDNLEIESKKGFTYSIELLVKSHRLGLKIGEVPAFWFDRKMGRSRFRLSKWIFDYLRWFFYAFATTYLKKSRESVKIKNKSSFRMEANNMNKEKVVFKTGHGTPVESCQICGGDFLESVLFLGYLPSVNIMNKIGEKPKEEMTYPAQLLYCPKCDTMQLGYIMDAKVIFPPEYPYTSSTTKVLRDNFAELYNECSGIINLGQDDLVIDIGSNDGNLLSNFKNKHRVLGVTPEDIGKLAIEKGIPTIINYFNKEVADKILSEHGKAKIITATNVFAHIEKVNEVIENILTLLDDGGVFISESHYLLPFIEKLQYDTIYHEHLRYYSLHSLKYLLESHGLEIFHAKEIPTHGGSIRVYAARKGKYLARESVAGLLEKEKPVTINRERFIEFKNKVLMSKLELYSKILEIKKSGAHIYGISAPSRASTLINYVGLDDGTIDCIVEVSGSHKIGKYIPGTLIPVLEESVLYEKQPEYAFLFSWHIADELMPKLRVKGYKGKFIVPLPEPRIVE